MLAACRQAQKETGAPFPKILSADGNDHKSGSKCPPSSNLQPQGALPSSQTRLSRLINHNEREGSAIQGSHATTDARGTNYIDVLQHGLSQCTGGSDRTEAQLSLTRSIRDLDLLPFASFHKLVLKSLNLAESKSQLFCRLLFQVVSYGGRTVSRAVPVDSPPPEAKAMHLHALVSSSKAGFFQARFLEGCASTETSAPSYAARPANETQNDSRIWDDLCQCANHSPTANCQAKNMYISPLSLYIYYFTFQPRLLWDF